MNHVSFTTQFTELWNHEVEKGKTTKTFGRLLADSKDISTESERSNRDREIRYKRIEKREEGVETRE